MDSHSELFSPKVKDEGNSPSRDASPEVKKENDFAENNVNTNEKQDAFPLEDEEEDEEDDNEVQIVQPDDDQCYSNPQNQLVLYDPKANGTSQSEPTPGPEYQHPFYPTYVAPSRMLPSVGAFTVQCANCFKWRLIPTKEKYEEIRESILQQPFICERAREWRPDICCDDPADISQDGSRLWAIDKPNIAQPPPGWERQLRIRGEGGTRFADVYYSTPTGKRLRSMVEVQKFLLEHPEYLQAGVTMSQFSFQIPKPLQENYVKKRPRADLSIQRTLEPTEVNPLSWAGPFECGEPQIGGAGSASPHAEVPVSHVTPRPTKRRTKSTSSKHLYSSNSACNQTGIKLEEPQASGNGAYDHL